MPILIDPPTYLSPNDFAASLDQDYDVSMYSDAQQLARVIAATGKANALMCRSLLPEERTKRVYGTGTSILNIAESPLLYVRQMRFAVPGTLGFVIPANQMLIDYDNGEITEFTPFVFSGLGYVSIFPRNVPIDITFASGYSYAIAAPNDISISDGAPGSLPLGLYDITVTSVTMRGESTPSTITSIGTGSGSFSISFPAVLGAFGYRVYIAPAGGTPTFVSEISGAQYESTYGGYAPITITVETLDLAPGTYPLPVPTVDTTLEPFPPAVVEATRLLAYEAILEQNNPANRGIMADKRQDGAGTSYRSTMGSEGKGLSWMSAQARDLLRPFKLAKIY